MLDKSKINVGDTHSEVVVEDLKRTQIVQYAGASGAGLLFFDLKLIVAQI